MAWLLLREFPLKYTILREKFSSLISFCEWAGWSWEEENVIIKMIMGTNVIELNL